jgi:hypothetical protein
MLVTQRIALPTNHKGFYKIVLTSSTRLSLLRAASRAIENYAHLKDKVMRPFEHLRALIARVLITFLLCITDCGTSAAYEVPLTPESLHEAYILGQRNDQATATFLNSCFKQITEGSEVPHIAEIQILTPFAQVVDLSRRLTSGYTEEQAARDYHLHGDTVVVRVVLMLPAAYPKPASAPDQPPAPPQPSPPPNAPLRPENFWQNFRFEMKQHGKTIATRFIRNKPIYSTPTKDTPAVLDGATVWLEYDAKDVASDETVVEVTTPDSKTINATFDLKQLR